MTKSATVDRLLAVLALAGLVLTVGLAQPASACSCAETDDAELFAQADAVFVGSVIDVAAARPAGPIWSSGDPVIWTFQVREVHKGEVVRTQEVVSAASSASCGLELPRRGTYLVFADAASFDHEPAQLTANLCGGTREAGVALAEGLGSARPPNPDPVPIAPAPAVSVRSPWSPPLAAVAGAIALGILGLAVATRRARRRP